MDDTVKPKSVNVVVLTVSDTRTEENDKSGDTL
ncbi:MAG: molybdenum cofactor biosynthesis protein, partial [Nitrospinae bacterium]|nr:molybdenum cofactor biosynthesis protein [Nitrospinota bacterium]